MSNTTYLTQVEQYYGRQFQHFRTIKTIADELTKAGPGTRAIVFGHWGDPEKGHFFNAINQQGTVRLLDGQTGTAANITDMIDGQLSIINTTGFGYK